jgi:hypothetical protein
MLLVADSRPVLVCRVEAGVNGKRHALMHSDGTD